MEVSVIMTVYNESRTIEALLDSLASQTRKPDEVVICDGGSSDDTVALIERHIASSTHGPPVRVLVENGANISRGRNVAIAAARGPVIAVTDAGTRLSPEWLKELTTVWKNRSPQDRCLPLAVAGFFVPDARSWFETAMAATVLPTIEEIEPTRFLPSSRSAAFLKDAWEHSGKYPEWLDYCEDLIFDIRLNSLRPTQETSFQWAPKAVVFFRPRSNLRAFWLQYYRYARGDGKADLWRKRHAIRYLVYLGLAPFLAGIGLAGEMAAPAGWVGLCLGGLAYCRQPWLRLASQWGDLTITQRILAGLTVPIVRVVGDVAKMAGYPTGLWWRWRNRHRDEIYWRHAAARSEGSSRANSD